MIIGAHTVVFSKNPDADRDFFRNVLKMPNVDAGGGWLIFSLPPAEMAVHPAKRNNVSEFYLMCDDVGLLMARMKNRGILCSPIQNRSWGLLTEVTLPGGGKLGIYQPLHVRPKAVNSEQHRV